MDSDNTSKRDHLVPRNPADHELQRLADEVSMRGASRGESARPPEPGIDIAKHFARDAPLAPPEPGETQLAHLVALSAHAVNSSARAAEGSGALRPREPTDAEIRVLLQRG